MDTNTAWDNYKSMLLKGEINADTYALLTADLPPRKALPYCEVCQEYNFTCDDCGSCKECDDCKGDK